MIDVKDFYNTLTDKGVDFFCGVPDSLLKNICGYINDNTPCDKHVISANEGGAVALAAGYKMGTHKVPLVYMQNSGLGNAVNPLTSLAHKDVYGVPMLLMIGWRGEPGKHDEPQHIVQGRITLEMLEMMGIPYYVLDGTSDYKTIVAASVDKCRELSGPVALVVKKGTFKPYEEDNEDDDYHLLTREDALKAMLPHVPEDCFVVSTTGMLSRELYEIREKQDLPHHRDFLTVGSMGHVSQIALGMSVALQNNRVLCLDGDGSLLMHLGNYAAAGELMPDNLSFILFNNEAHDSVGGQPSVGERVDFPAIMEAFNITNLGIIWHEHEFEKAVRDSLNASKPTFLEVRIKRGHRKSLGRPHFSPKENKRMIIKQKRK